MEVSFARVRETALTLEIYQVGGVHVNIQMWVLRFLKLRERSSFEECKARLSLWEVHTEEVQTSWGGCGRKGGKRRRRAGGGAGLIRTGARRWRGGRRIQNVCRRCKNWGQGGPQGAPEAQRGCGMKPGPQAGRILLSCEKDTGSKKLAPKARELTSRDPKQDQRQSGQK